MSVFLLLSVMVIKVSGPEMCFPFLMHILHLQGDVYLQALFPFQPSPCTAPAGEASRSEVLYTHRTKKTSMPAVQKCLSPNVSLPITLSFAVFITSFAFEFTAEANSSKTASPDTVFESIQMTTKYGNSSHCTVLVW